MSELVFQCDLAPEARRRGFALFVLACLLWLPVSLYLPWAALGFVAIAVYFDRLWHMSEEVLLEVSVSANHLSIRRPGDDAWCGSASRPRIWGAWVVAAAPSSLVPFGMLFLSERMLGGHTFRELRRMVRS